MNNVVVAIPAFEPSPALVGLVDSLASNVRAIVVVDDGCRKNFDVLNDITWGGSVVCITHIENRGKGAALKTAFRECLRRYPNAVGVVTADADGQHRSEDVLRVARSLEEHQKSLVLGVRTFSRKTPFRSLLGNFVSRGEILLLTGQRIADAQTGLRGIPVSLLPRLLDLPGDRYDYEMRALVDCIRRIGAPVQISIDTVYVDGNVSSHYRPLADTLSIQCALLSACFGIKLGSSE